MSSGKSTYTQPKNNSSGSSCSNNTNVRYIQSDEDFNIRFVNLIKIQKCLYDKKVPEYRNRDYQDKAWSLISKETQESVIHCKERWRNLRACLSRYIKQQSSNDPQHKPYYLTEHMAFLLPYLKPNRISHTSGTFQAQQTPGFDLYKLAEQQSVDLLEMKRSLSDNDEETKDAFDHAGTAAATETAPIPCNISGHIINRPLNSHTPISDTNSTNTMNNFIPDVQIELRTSDCGDSYQAFDIHHNSRNSAFLEQNYNHHKHFNGPSQSKRSKTKIHAMGVGSGVGSTNNIHYRDKDCADMEFFRSILPDLAELTPHQKRKFKIGILELIDDVVTRYPSENSTSANKANLRSHTTTNDLNQRSFNSKVSREKQK